MLISELRSGSLPLAKLLLLCIIKIGKGRLMGSVRSGEKHKRKKADKPTENWGKELNIRYHDVNPQWNYTISPRLDSTSGEERQKERE